MITREALDKVRDELAEKTANSDHPDYENGFDAAVSLLWPVIEQSQKLMEKAEADLRMQEITNGKSYVRIHLELADMFAALSELKERVK